jgi:hypothetical protein
MAYLLNQPTPEEFKNVSDVKKQIHGYSYNLLHIAESICRENRDAIEKIERFSRDANRYYKIKPLGAVTFYYYANSKVTGKEDKFLHILRFINHNNELSEYIKSKNGFANIYSAIKWLIAYRCAKIFFVGRLNSRLE